MRPAGAAVLLGLTLLLLGGCKTTTTFDGAQVPNNAGAMGVVEGDAKKRAAVRLQLAANYYQGGQVEIAIETARRAIDLDPESVGAHSLLGLMLMDVGQVAQADASFQRALALDKNNADLNNNYGWFLCQTGHERDSIAYFDRAVADRLYSTPARALQNAGICLLRVRDEPGGERYLLRALQFDATSPVAKFQLAQLYLHQRRFLFRPAGAHHRVQRRDAVAGGPHRARQERRGDRAQLQRATADAFSRFPANRCHASRPLR
jgi:type IV pilus assembly protein PilF